MTIDEAIKHCEEKAQELKYEAEHFGESIACIMKKEACIECANEHEQLAEWLIDYKKLLAENSHLKQELATFKALC